MNFAGPLAAGVLLRRRQRFLADIELDDGRVVTAHCPNTGAMRGCSTPGSRVYFSWVANPGRRTRCTLELVRAGRVLVGVNTGRANQLAEEALARRLIPTLAGVAHWRREVTWKDSRFDFRLEDDAGFIFLEVKSVTLVEGGRALFPDAVTERGRRHLRTLARAVSAGHRAAMLYIAPRGDARIFAPADHVDLDYGAALRAAARQGVAVLAWRARATRRRLVLEAPLPVDLGPRRRRYT